MGVLSDIGNGLLILAKYGEVPDSFHACDKQIVVLTPRGHGGQFVTDEDRDEMVRLGWRWVDAASWWEKDLP